LSLFPCGLIFLSVSSTVQSRGSSAGIATGYGLVDRGGGGRSSSPGKVKNFYFSISSCSGAHPASHAMSTKESFSWGGEGGNAVGVWSWPFSK
jgi:hypothetical protein